MTTLLETGFLQGTKNLLGMEQNLHTSLEFIVEWPDFLKLQATVQKL